MLSDWCTVYRTCQHVTHCVYKDALHSPIQTIYTKPIWLLKIRVGKCSSFSLKSHLQLCLAQYFDTFFALNISNWFAIVLKLFWMARTLGARWLSCVKAHWVVKDSRFLELDFEELRDYRTLKLSPERHSVYTVTARWLQNSQTLTWKTFSVHRDSSVTTGLSNSYLKDIQCTLGELRNYRTLKLSPERHSVCTVTAPWLQNSQTLTWKTFSVHRDSSVTTELSNSYLKDIQRALGELGETLAADLFWADDLACKALHQILTHLHRPLH